MPRYTFNGKTYNIPDEKVDSFLTKNLGAEPLNINSFSDVETTEETKQKQQQNFATQQAIIKDNPDNMVFEDLPDQYGLTNPNQGAFGFRADYFTPRPLQPELNIEEYDIEAKEKEYKIDTKEKEEALRKKYKLNSSELLDHMETLPPTKEEAIAINEEANVLFPVDNKGNYSVGVLNPEEKITQEGVDFGVETTFDVAGKLLGIEKDSVGEKVLGFVKDILKTPVSTTIEGVARNFQDGKIGGKDLLDEETQKKVTTQLEYIEKAKIQLAKQVKAGTITQKEADNPNTQLELSKSLYVEDKELKVYRKNLTKFLDEDVDKSWFNLAKPELQKRLEELYDVHKSNLDKATKDSLETTETTSIALDAISKQFENQKKLAEKGEITREQYFKKIEELNKEQNRYLDLALRASEDYKFLVKDVDEIKAYGDLIGRNYNGITSTVGKMAAAGIDIGVNMDYYLNKLHPKNILTEVILPIANSKYPDSKNGLLLTANNAMIANDAIFKNTGVDILGSKDKDKKRDEYNEWIENYRSKLELSTSYSDIKDIKSFGKWAVGFLAEQSPQLGLMIFAPQIALPILGASAGGAKFDQMRQEKFKGEKNYTPLQMISASTFTGITEIVSERITMNILGRLKVRNMPVEGVKKSFTQSLKDGLFNVNRWRATGFNLNQEGLSEVYAKIGENVADRYIAGKEEVGIFDDVQEAYVSGVFMAGTLFNAPAIGNKLLAPFKTKDLNIAFNKNVNTINQLTSQLSKTSDARTVDVINNKINELVMANSNIRVDQAMSTDYLQQEQKNELLNIYKQEAQNTKDINIIKNDKTLDSAAQNEIINGLEIENSKLSEQREAIMKPAIETHYKETTERVKEIVKDIEGVTVKEIDNVEAENIARQKRNNEKMSLAETEGKDLDTIETEILLDADLPGSYNPTTGEIIINKEAALKNKQVNVAAHELLHGIMAQTFKGNPAAQKAFGQSVLSELSKIEGIDETNFAARIQQYQEAVETKEISQEDAYEEAMNLLADAIATKDIKIPETFLQKIGKLITNIAGKLGWQTKFNKGSDVVSFIKNFQKEVGEGKLSDETLQVAKEGAKGKLTKPTSTKAKPTKKASLPTVKGVKPTQVKDMVGKVANRAVAKYFRGIPRNIREKAGLDRATYLDSAKTELTEIAQKYDPTKKDKDGNQVSFERYMANTGMQRLNALATKLGVESAEQGVTESLDSPQAKQVADTTTEAETTLDTKPIIDVMNFAKKADPSINVKQFEQDFTQGVEALAKEKGIDITNPNLTSQQLQSITPYDILAKAIGIPANKLSNAADNLSKSESLKAQRILLAAKPFIKNVVLGQANKQVQTVASKKKGGKPVKVGGESLRLGRNILNTFFNPPKRVGNNYVRTPKKFDNKVYDAAIGTQAGKVDPNYVPRASESQTIKGLLKAVAEQMANRGARNILDTQTQTSDVVRAKANLERGKSKLMFSKSILKKHGNKHKFKTYAPNEGEIDTDGIYKNTKKYADDIIKIINSGKFPVGLLNKGSFMNRALWGNSKKRSEVQQKSYDFLSKKLDGVKALKKTDPRYAKTKASSLIKEDFTGTFNDIISWFANPKNNIKAYNKRNSEMFDDGWNAINKLLNSPKGKELAPAIYWMLNSTTTERSHFHALAEVVSYNIFADPTAKVEWEHAVQSTTAYNFLFDAALDSNVNFAKALKALKKNYKIIGITKQQNQLITDAGYKNNMPKINGKEFDIYKDSWIERYNKTPGLDLTSQDWVVKSPNPYGEISKLYSKAKNKETKVLKDGQKFKYSKRGKKIIEQNKEIESQDLSKGFNDIIETNKGLASEARYSGIMAKRKGMEKGKYRFFIPPSAEDFKGLLYNFLGKGKTGETQMKWFKEKLIDPYNQGVAQMERYRRALKGDYATLLKESPNVRKQLGKKIKGIDFTYDNAIRAYLWNKDGVEIPGLSKRDTKALVDAITKNPEMKAFAEGLQLISKKPAWIKPTVSWDVQSITSDIHNFTSREGRKEYLGEFIDNANQIFSKDNLNKIEGVYGTNVKEALEDALYRMKTGINRPSGTNRLTNNFNNWVNRSIGAIMFFNRKSALLQTISSVNFVNWSDNNPIKAAAAFANQKQYWSDVVKIFNSPKLKSRRAGLKGDINESELASAAANATNKAEAALSYLLKIGFTPTQLADSFAIATGGATFLRNRINTYKKQGMSEVEADKQAWKDFSAISEETQQSADPSLISQQQASPLGRLILAFQNTPMQYTRLMKKAGQDLINGRGDAKTHISKIIYYGAVQNFIFSALQNALFAAIPGFSGEDDEEEETKGEIVQNRKNIRIANNMVDTVLRGSGVYGAIGATLKNTIMKYYENEKKDPFAKDNASILLEAINLSPPIGSKLRKLNNALKTKEFEKDVISERGWEMTRNGRINLSPSYRVLGSTLEAGLNIPLERTLAEIDAIMEMTDQRNSAMERIALGLGWRTWDIGVPNEEHDQIKVEAKEKKKQARKDKVISDREEKKRLEEERKYLGKTEEEIKLIKEKDSIFDTNKSAQIISLTNLGLTKKEIRELKLEEDRVDKILELTN